MSDQVETSTIQRHLFVGASGKAGDQHIMDILTNPLYAGYLQYDKLTKALHDPLISFETHHQIMERLKAKAQAPTRKNINADSLRGFVNCTCGQPYTAAWSKGRNAHYPYYLCQTKGCEHYRKSIKRSDIEGEFESLLKAMVPTKKLIKLADKVFRKVWGYRIRYHDARKSSFVSEMKNLDQQIQQTVDRLIDTTSPTALKALEERIENFENKQCVLSEKIENIGHPVPPYETIYRTAMKFLENPYILWSSGRLGDQRTVLKLAFEERLTYVRGEGYRTAKTTLPFKVLDGFFGRNMSLVGRTGLTTKASGLLIALRAAIRPSNLLTQFIEPT